MTDDQAPSRRDRWARVDALFARALDLPAHERGAFLEQSCGNDAELRAEVEDLLAITERSPDFLEGGLALVTGLDLNHLHGLVAGERSSTGRREPDRTGARLGPYRIVERVGRGGMATVYRAERADGQWTQEVAVKVLRRGLDTDDIVERFRAERQILSSLRHPNIARLLDGGTTEDGLPYLVMEYVNGTAITRYCDARSMGIDDRLRLFCKVARAVQDAHRNLVVHRDIKPSNILVDDQGEPRLLDFGIAKVVGAPSEAEGRTRNGQLLLTPEYASPEQLRGGVVTTSSDVYQLGVLLSVLLCGSKPTGPEATAEAARARGADGDRLKRRLKGDLDTIIDVCVKPDPEDRFASVEALVADVERHLNGFPIQAKRQPWHHRASRLIRRRPVMSAAAALVLIQAIVYGVTVTQNARALRVQTQVAESEAEAARQVQEFLVDLFATADPYMSQASGPASEVTVVEALGRGAARVRGELAGQPLIQARLLAAIADVYENLGSAESAVPLHRESLDLYRSHLGEDAPTTLETARLLGQSLYESGQVDEAYAWLTTTGADAERVLGPSDSTTIRTVHMLGRAALGLGRPDEARDHLEDALERAQALSPPRHDLEADTRYWLARAYLSLDDPETALGHATQSLEYSRSTLGEGHTTTGVKAISRADVLVRLGRIDDGVDAYREGIRILTASMGPGHPNVTLARNNLALALQASGDLEGAEEVFRGLLIDADSNSLSHAIRLQNLAVNLERQGEYAEAMALLGRAHEAFVQALPSGHYRTAFPLLTRSGIELREGAFRNAEATARQALATLVATLPAGHYVTAVARCRVGRALWSQDRKSEGRRWLAQAASDLERSEAVAPDRAAECLRAYSEALDPVGDSARVAELGVRLDSLERSMGAGAR